MSHISTFLLLFHELKNDPSSLPGGRGAADGLSEAAAALHELDHLLHRPPLPPPPRLPLPEPRVPVHAPRLSTCQDLSLLGVSRQVLDLVNVFASHLQEYFAHFWLILSVAWNKRKQARKLQDAQAEKLTSFQASKLTSALPRFGCDVGKQVEEITNM